MNSTHSPAEGRSATTPKRTNWAKWVAAACALFLALVVAAEFTGWSFLRLPLQHQIEKRLGAAALLESPFRLRLIFSPNLAISRVTVEAPDGMGVAKLLEAKDLEVRWRWRDLLSHRAGEPWKLLAVHASQMELNLIRAADGRATWPVDALDAPDQPAVRFEPPVRVTQLKLESARVVYRDAITQSDLLAVVRTGQDQASGDDLHAQVEGQWQGRAVRLLATSGATQALFDEVQGSAADNSIPVSVRGRIGGTEFSFRGVAADLLSARALQGSLLARGPSLSVVGDALGLTLPTTPPFRLATALSHDNGLWTVHTSQVQIGGSRLAGDFVYDGRPEQPLLSGTLGGEVLRLKDLGPAIGGAAPADIPVLTTVLNESAEFLGSALTAVGLPGADAPSQPAPPKNRVLPIRRFDLPTLRAMDAEVSVRIDKLDLGDDAAIEPLHDLKTKLSLRAGVLTLTDLTAQAAGGRISGMTQLDAADESRAARWQADLRLDDLKLDRWLRVLQRDGKPLLTGRLGGRVQVRGEGASTAELLATMDGRADARLTQGEVSHLAVEAIGLDLAQGLGVLLRGDDALAVSCFVVQTQIKQGVVRATHVVADTPDTRMRVSGQLDLGDETLALRAVAQPKDFSPFSLRTPLLVGGTLAEPEVGLEARRLAPRLAAALALTAVAGPAGLLPFLEFGSDAASEQDPCGAASKAPTHVK